MDLALHRGVAVSLEGMERIVWTKHSKRLSRCSITILVFVAGHEDLCASCASMLSLIRLAGSFKHQEAGERTNTCVGSGGTGVGEDSRRGTDCILLAPTPSHRDFKHDFLHQICQLVCHRRNMEDNSRGNQAQQSKLNSR